MLAASGHEVHVLSCCDEQADRDYMDRKVFVHLRGQVRIPGIRRLSEFLRLSATVELIEGGLSNYLEYRRLDIDFDVIEYPDLDAVGWLFAFLHNKPLVAHLHLPTIMSSLFQPGNEISMMSRNLQRSSFLERFAVHHADVVTCPSKLTVRKLKDIGWLREINPTIIPQFVNWQDWCNTNPVENTPPTVLYLGWLGLNKAPELLVEAISIIRNKIPDAKALFVGESLEHRDGLPYIDWLKKSQADLSGCEFVRYIPHDKVIRFISSSRVLAMPSWFENYPMAVLEAMAGGRPVVVTSTTGVAELIEKTGAGQVLPSGDPNALADALLPFLTDAAYAAEIGERAREAVRELHDPDKIIGQRERVYRQAIMNFEIRQ